MYSWYLQNNPALLSISICLVYKKGNVDSAFVGLLIRNDTFILNVLCRNGNREGRDSTRNGRRGKVKFYFGHWQSKFYLVDLLWLEMEKHCKYWFPLVYDESTFLFEITTNNQDFSTYIITYFDAHLTPLCVSIWSFYKGCFERNGNWTCAHTIKVEYLIVPTWA